MFIILRLTNYQKSKIAVRISDIKMIEQRLDNDYKSYTHITLVDSRLDFNVIETPEEIVEMINAVEGKFFLPRQSNAI